MVAILPNFPMKNQLTEKTADGKPPENARFDCVAVSFASAIQFYDGGYISGDELKDAEYGDTYANAGTALWKYVDNATDLARSKYHCTAVPFNDSNTNNLVGRVHTWLRQGIPVIATIPSAWGTAHPMNVLDQPNFSTHVICFYSEEGGLTAMNPWGGFKQTEPDSWWEGRLCYGQVWAVVREGAPSTMLQIAQTLGFFTQDSTNDTKWLCPTKKLTVMGAILQFYRSLAGAGMGAGGLSIFGLPVTEELAPDSTYAGRIQFFEKGVIACDPSFKWDKPAGYATTGGVGCYCPHIDTGWVHDNILGPLKTQLATAQSQLTAAQTQVTKDAAQITALNTQITTLGNQNTSLEAQLTAAQNAKPQLTPAQQADLDMAAALRKRLTGE